MSGQRDFDFEFGSWQVSHRRLRDRLTHCQEWDEFLGHSETRPVMGGAGNVEDNLLHLPTGDYRAIAVRSFDVTRDEWAIWWLSSLSPHVLDVPVKGRFEGNEGAFFAADVLRGRPVKVRFLWRKGEVPRWEQAFSGDSGISWETNWTMDFTRA